MTVARIRLRTCSTSRVLANSGIMGRMPANQRVNRMRGPKMKIRTLLAPVLHAKYLPHLQLVTPILMSGGITLAPYDDKVPGGSKFVLKFHRRADSWASLEPPPEGTVILAETKRAGMPMVTLYQLP